MPANVSSLGRAVIVLAALATAGCVCGPGEVLCGGRCSPVARDRENCGACGVDCGAGTCDRGGCTRAIVDLCTTNLECSDGISCNGREVCQVGLSGGRECRAGSPIRCNDGIACTLDVCREAGGGTCESLPDDSRCGVDGICSGDGPVGCGEPCDASPCQLLSPQCGCSSGEACYVGTSVACLPAGTIGPQRRCTSANDCAPGLACANLTYDAAVPIGVCVELCGSSVDCDPVAAEQRCVDVGFFGAAPSLGICAAACDLVEQTGCGSGSHCEAFYDSSEGTAYTLCVGPDGAVPPHAACLGANDCAPGSFCVRTSGGSVCWEWCRSDSDCGPGGDCALVVDPEIVIAGARYGGCR